MLQLLNSTFKLVGLREDNAWTAMCAIKNGLRFSPQCPYPGISVEALLLLQQALGFSYEIIWANTHDEIENFISNGTADFTLNFLTYSKERYSKFHFLPPLHYIELGFMGKRPAAVVEASTVLEPFSPGLWSAFLVVFFLIAFVISIDRIFSIRRYFDCLFRLLSFTFNQDDTNWFYSSSLPKNHQIRRRRCTAISMKLLLLYYSVFLLVMQTLYTSVLMSHLSPVHPAQPYQDSDQLATLVDNGERILTRRASKTTSSWFVSIMSSNLSAHIRMRNVIEHTKFAYYQENKEVVPMLKADTKLVVPVTALSYITLTRLQCSLLYQKDMSLIDNWESIVMRKNFPFKALFERAIRENGIQDMLLTILETHYYKDMTKSYCKPRRSWKSNNLEEKKFITLEKIQTVLGVLLIGSLGILSPMVFGLELLIDRFSNRLNMMQKR